MTVMQTAGTPTPAGAAAANTSMLLPPMSKLLPPLSPLIPPGALLARGGIATGTGMGSSARADEALEQIGQGLKAFSHRTSDFVVAQAPKVKAAQRSAAEYMTKAAHELGDAKNRRSFMQKYRRWLQAGAGGIGCLVLIGWGIAHHHASQKAEKGVHDALQSMNLLGVVEYGSVSTSLFGTVSLSDVKWHVAPAVDITASSVDISRIDTAHTIPYYLDLSFSGITLPIQKIVAAGPGAPIPGTLASFAREVGQEGYNTLQGSLNIGYGLQKNTSVMTMTSSGNFPNFGNWHGKIQLGNFSPVLLDTATLSVLDHNVRGINPMTVFNIAQNVGRLTLQAVDVTLDTTGADKRDKEIPGTPMPQQNTDAADQQTIAMKENEARHAGLPDDQAHLAALLMAGRLPAFTMKSSGTKSLPITEVQIPLPRMMQRLDMTLGTP
ncbi:hypothetical protein K6L44_07675 [Gluconacetobacter entanii]|uniref:hypothetical protein n=2 Tax=Gluconacetobacter entanii TaxID=108528 RepID=UPI001C931AF0|nr:hypothetical protein [Gluconacetobacter entanii]MBY4639868.1 hypothetical protein [Gluconacetobacter entanii]MCW4581109.1 hypothetical protein [Gluconacetobacter entanii]MCW4584369.1 hypothetical protein [Gluconacetobacter entanii]MCW4587783.1 hypothetical protein [Gluconacetobacter entanii]